MIFSVITYACILFTLAILCKTARLWLCLGSPRPRFALLLFACICGLISSYELAFVFIYEIMLLCILAVWYRNILFRVMYCLIILRAFDILAILVISLTTPQLEGIHTALILFVVIISITLTAVYALEPILLRAERSVLEYPQAHSGDIYILSFLSKIRGDLSSLAWNSKGTLSAVLFLTILTWLFEWSAIFFLSISASDASSFLIQRILLSLTLSLPSLDTPSGTSPYDLLIHYSYFLLIPLGLWIIIKCIQNKRKAR